MKNFQKIRRGDFILETEKMKKEKDDHSDSQGKEHENENENEHENENRNHLVQNCFTDNEKFKIHFLLLFVWGTYRMFVLTMSCYCAMIHRRHLMVWAIFAPKVSAYVSVLFAIFFVLICSRTGLCSEHFSFSFLFYSPFFILSLL